MVMKSRNIDIDDLSYELDVTPGHLRKLLKGDHRWKSEYIKKASEILNVDYDFLCNGSDSATAILVDDKLKKVEINLSSLLGLEHVNQKKELYKLFSTIAEIFRD